MPSSFARPAVIRVRSGRKDDRVALWERHPDHPNGEIFVAGDRVVEAAETAAVQRALQSGDLVRVDERGGLWTDRVNWNSSPHPGESPDEQLEAETGHKHPEGSRKTGDNPPTFVETDKPADSAAGNPQSGSSGKVATEKPKGKK